MTGLKDRPAEHSLLLELLNRALRQADEQQLQLPALHIQLAIELLKNELALQDKAL